MVLGKEDQTLFLVCTGGTILSVKCPLQEPVHYADFNIHSVDITKVETYMCYNYTIAISFITRFSFYRLLFLIMNII